MSENLNDVLRQERWATPVRCASREEPEDPALAAERLAELAKVSNEARHLRSVGRAS